MVCTQDLKAINTDRGNRPKLGITPNLPAEFLEVLANSNDMIKAACANKKKVGWAGMKLIMDEEEIADASNEVSCGEEFSVTQKPLPAGPASSGRNLCSNSASSRLGN